MSLPPPLINRLRFKLYTRVGNLSFEKIDVKKHEFKSSKDDGHKNTGIKRIGIKITDFGCLENYNRI
jgi:hypothetical protein